MPTPIARRQLRSSSAHRARKLAKSWQGGSEHGSGCRHGRGTGGGRGGGGGEGVGEGGREQLCLNLTTLTWQVGNQHLH